MSFDVVFFELRGRRCAIAVSAVREVITLQNITPVPLAPPAIRGIAPLHGQVLPVIDLGVWLSPGPESRTDTRSDAPVYGVGMADKALRVEATIEGETTPVTVALAVDTVLRLGTVDESHSRPAPAGPAFVSAMVLDVEGPALLIDADQAVEAVRKAIAAGVQA